MEDQIFIQHRFTRNYQQDSNNPNSVISFTDAITLPEEDYNKLTDQDIENIKQQRFDNWVNSITNPNQQQGPDTLPGGGE